MTPSTTAQRDAFLEASQELAEELALEEYAPSPVQSLPARGLVRWIRSRSRPDHIYTMVWTPVSGWVHADDSCPAFGMCWHREDVENMTSLVVRKNDALVERPVLLVEYDAKALSDGVAPELAAKWAYDLGSSGQGVSARGAEEGMRLLASHGEIIRVDCHLEGADEREAFFVATATRYLITPEGQEIRLDSQSRGKRVPKREARANGQGDYEVKNWFEIGMVKASRNAALALMPSNVKTALLRAGLDAAAEVKGNGGGQRQQSRGPQQRQQAPTQPAEPQITDDQRQLIVRFLKDLSPENQVWLTAEFPRNFPPPGPGAQNSARGLSQADAARIIARLCPHAYAFDQDKALNVCSLCGTPEVAPFSDADATDTAQASLLPN